MNKPHKKAEPRTAFGSAQAALRSIWTMFPLIVGILLLMSLLAQLLPALVHSGLLGKHPFLDAFSGAAIGSIAAGQPIASYLLGGELLANHVGLIGVTALVVSWVTVGIANLPLEAAAFNWRFALLRNLLSFIFSIVIAFLIAGIVYGR